jgi:hypothetical protein
MPRLRLQWLHPRQDWPRRQRTPCTCRAHWRQQPQRPARANRAECPPPQRGRALRRRPRQRSPGARLSLPRRLQRRAPTALLLPPRKACRQATRAPSTIQILSGPSAGKELPLTKPLTTLGKQGVQVAVITKRPQGYFITHVEGTSPVVNGKPLDAQAHPLSDHDVIELAQAAPGVKMEFFLKPVG